MNGDIVLALCLVCGLVLPFFPVAALLGLAVLIVGLFVPARWFGFDDEEKR